MIVVFAAALFLGTVQLPDLSRGSINGRVAVIAFPQSRGQILEATSCHARLARIADVAGELVYPCGQWFQPPPGEYHIWIEKDDYVSPIQYSLVYSGGPFKGKGLGVVFDVVPGGRAHLDPGLTIESGYELRILHLDSHLGFPTLRRAFERRIAAADAHQRLLVPAGH